jgi:DNA-binding response OmpR family regulator
MRLLLVEDEKDLSRALTAILKHENYSVDAVYDGEEALLSIRSGIYDGIILDIMIPKIDGLSVLRTIRAEENATPVLLLTAKSEVEDRVLGLDAGADDYLTKPFASKELLARIRAMLRRKTETVSTLLKFGNTTLDAQRFELSVNESSVRLPNKEFQIMELLMQTPNVIIPQEKLLEKIWGQESENVQNVVWVYVSYLRKKLLGIGSDIEINSHRNVGYSLERREK